MRARDNEFVERILDLADAHFDEELGNDKLQAAVTEKWTEVESQARACGEPFNLENVRWAVRRILFRPDAWPDLNLDKGAVRRAALDKVLVLCKN